MQSREIISHHSIRGIAAVFVMALHLTEIVAWGAGGVVPRCIQNGYLWVDCFFILSGFILSHVYAESFELFGFIPLLARVKRFWWARFARVYPLHILSLGLIVFIREFALLARKSDESFFWGVNQLDSLVANIILVQSWELFRTTTWNYPAWSISTEVFAYLMFPLICMLRARAPHLILAILITFSAFALTTLMSLNGSLSATCHLGLLRCVGGFSLGIAVHIIWLKHPGNFFNYNLSTMQIPLVAIIIICMCMDGMDLIAVFSFAALILATADDRGVLSKILRHSALQKIGALSFSIYMLHHPVIYAAGEFKWFIYEYWVRRGAVSSEILAWMIATTALLATFVLSSIIHRHFEMPARVWLTRSLYPTRVPLSFESTSK